MTITRQKSLAVCFGVLCSLLSCHQNPALPGSLIPPGCRVAEAAYIDTTSTPVFTYQYDGLDNRIQSNDNKGVRTYTFDADKQYVISQQVGGITLIYQYDGTPKQISRISGGPLSYDYTYEGGLLKTYTVKDSKGTSTYNFANGKLSTVTVTNGENLSVTDGRISQRKKTDGTLINYSYTQGQLAQTDSIATNERKLTTYKYDNNYFYANTGLLIRGVPVFGADERVKWQPGPGLDDVGGPVQLNNFQTINIKYYRRDAAGTETLISDRTLTYHHAYNQANYSTGYGRSDGARAKFYYTNCN